MFPLGKQNVAEILHQTPRLRNNACLVSVHNEASREKHQPGPHLESYSSVVCIKQVYNTIGCGALRKVKTSGKRASKPWGNLGKPWGTLRNPGEILGIPRELQRPLGSLAPWAHYINIKLT